MTTNVGSTGTGPDVGRLLARQGLQAMLSPAAGDDQNRASIGDTYVAAVGNRSGGDTERYLSYAALNVNYAGSSARSQKVVAESTLKAVATGASGPLSSVLASVGRDAMNNPELEDAHEKASIGFPFTYEISERADDPSLKVRAAEAYQAALQAPSAQEQAQVLDSFLFSVA